MDLDASKYEIRLLELLPVKDDEQLQLRLVSPISLSSNTSSTQDYGAVSYLAGNHKETTEIFVNDIRFNAFASLACALRHIIYRREGVELDGFPQLIWVDQICINQSNPQERSHQVAFMRKIFESAKIVLAYLGEDDGSGRWVNASKRLYYGTPINEARKIRLDHTGIYIADHNVGVFEDNRFQEDWSALRDIFSSAWWQRGWIYQEALVASKMFLLFGNGIVRFDDFSTAIWICNGVTNTYITDLSSGRMELLSSGEINKLLGMGGNTMYAAEILQSRDDWKKTKERNILELLQYSRSCKVTDPRDLVFAFVGLANQHYQIVPDYQSDITRVFVLACKRIILHETSLSILCYCGEEGRRQDLPTWVPDWSCEVALGIYKPTTDTPAFRASMDFRSAAAFRSNNAILDSVLMLQCLIVDQLGTQPSPNTFRGGPSHLETDPNFGKLSFEDCKRITEVESDNIDSKETNKARYQPNKSLTASDALWNVLIRGRHTGSENPEELYYYSRTFGASLESYRIFRSPKGYLSLIEQNARYTDQICVLLGANVPFVLRHVDDHYILIGPAYVEGLMYGEAIEMMKRGELEVETIEIC